MPGTDAATPRLRQESRLRNYSLAGGFVAVLLAVCAAVLLMSGSSSGSGVGAAGPHRAAGLPAASAAAASRTVATAPDLARSHAVSPGSGATTHRVSGAAVVARAHATTAAGAAHGGIVAEQPDPEAAYSAPAPPSVHHAPAVAPSSAAAMVAPGAPSDAQVRAELRAMNAAVAAEQSTPASANAIAGDGTVQPPVGVPAVIARVIAGANAITDFPYVYGGGHASFVDSAYDCSGSVSYALAAGGLLSAPETSGQLESWGAPGPGRWLTVYASAGHVYMFVDGLRYDTAGRTGVFSTRWQTGPDPVSGPTNAGFVVRHWPGL